MSDEYRDNNYWTKIWNNTVRKQNFDEGVVCFFQRPNRRRSAMVDMYCSPEALEDIRNWAVYEVDEQTKKEIWMTIDKSITKLYGVNMIGTNPCKEIPLNEWNECTLEFKFNSGFFFFTSIAKPESIWLDGANYWTGNVI